MPTGAITTAYMDVAQLTLYAFWIFFAGLIFYLRREDKREGYPLVSEPGETGQVRGFPVLPKPKVFLLPHGGTVLAPRAETLPEPALSKAGYHPGAPYEPAGDPMRDGVGPAAWCERADVPDLTFDEGIPKIVPLRAAPGWSLAEEDADPRGMQVVAADGKAAGTVSDVWIDRAEVIARYLEIDTGARRVLVPMTLVSGINEKLGRVTIETLTAELFAGVPATAHPDQITLREEDRISAWYGGGQLYALPDRFGPLL